MLGLLFGLITLVLTITFVVTMFAPGPVGFEGLFHLLQPATDPIGQLADLFAIPVRWALGYVTPHLPGFVADWFPTFPLAQLVEGVVTLINKIPGLGETIGGQSTAHADYSKWTPGIVDWSLPISVWFWDFLHTRVFYKLPLPGRMK